jgi:recombination DNA repair RAD52 pathway protein
MSELYQRLSERFPTEAHKTKEVKTKKGVQYLTYIEAEDQIGRLNQTFGVSWSEEILREHFDPEKRYAYVVVRLTYTDEAGVTHSKTGIGADEDKWGGAEFDKLLKSAHTEAIKNAAKLLGVCLYLYDKEELKEVEREMRQPQQTNRRPPDQPPARRHPTPTTAPQRTPEDEAFTQAMVEARKAVKAAGMRITDGQLTDAINRMVTKKAKESTAEPVAIIECVTQTISSKPEILFNVLTPKEPNPEAPFVAGGAA